VFNLILLERKKKTSLLKFSGFDVRCGFDVREKREDEEQIWVFFTLFYVFFNK